MKNKVLLIFAVSLLTLQDILAQAPGIPSTPTTDGNTEDVPIHFLVYPFLLLGAYIGFKFLKKK